MSQFLDSQPEDENSKLVITRTNQLHTAQLSAFLRHLLPIPNSMLPYISLMTHASKPPSLSAIVTRPNYASLLVGDAISSEKAKALEDRQDRDTTEGAFTTSIRLSKDEKTHLLKEIINSNVMDAHINSANDVYHKAQNEVIDIYFKRDSEEIDAIPSKKNTHKNSNSAQDVINTNMASHKPHMSLINPTTNQQFIPVTMNQNEWIETFTGDNPANTSLRSISDMNLIHSEDLVYPSSTRVPAHAILYAPNPNKKVNDMKKQQQRRSRAVNLNHNDTSAPRRDFEIDMQYGIDEIPQQNSKGFMGRNDNGGKRFGERNGGNNNRSFDRNNRSNNQNSSPSDFGINPNALGGNVSMKVNNSFDDANEKRAERELRYDLKPNSYDNNGERRIDRGNSSNFNRSGDRPSSNRNDRNSGFRGGFGNRNGDHSRDNTGDRPFGRNRDQKSSYQHGNSYKNNNNGYDGKNEQNEKRQYQPRDRDNFVKKMNANQQKDGNKSPNQNRDPMGSFDTTSSQTPKKTSLRDLKYSNPPSTTGKRTFTTSGRISRSTNRSLLPPTLRKMAPYARLGLINPGMITDILKRHFGTQTGAGNVWKNIMKQEKEAQDGQFKHNNNNPNNYHAREKAKISDNKDKGQFENEKDGKNKSAEKGPKFDKSEKGNKRDKFSNKFSPNPRDQTSFNHVNTNNIPQRSVPRGDSRRSRDKARSKDDRLEVWNRSAPSTKLLGADDLNDVAPVDSFELEPTLSDQKLEPKEAKKLKEARDAAKRDSIQTINQTFVQYPDTVPTLLPKAPVKSLYSTAESPIDVISQMYWTGTSKSRKRKNKKVLGKQNDSKNGNKIPDLNGLHQKDEELEGYRLEIDSAIEVLFDQDAEAGERFEALSKYENFHKLAQDALSYLTKSVEVYTNQTKLFNIPLNQPLYSSPSSPWVMTNLLRHEIYDNTTASVDSLDIESYGKLPGHIPMIKDILVLNELHSTEYQTLRKNNGDTIMGEFYKETVENHVNERIAHLLDIKTSTTTTLEKAQKIEQQENEHNRGKISIKIAQNELDSETAQGDSKHQRAQRVPANSNTLGDAISRLAATVATETTMGFNPAMSIMGQKYQNFNSLMIPVNIDNHGAHNIFIDGNSNQTIALQYNGFGSAQIFLKQFQYYTDFIARMSYSAMNPNTPAVQYINNIHDEQYLSYSDKYKQRETMFQNKRGKNGQQQEQTPFPEKKNKNDNFISTSLILCDPAYETGEEYVHVLDLLRTTLDFNSRGNAHTLAIWYPVLDKIDPLLPDPVLNQAEDDEFDQNGYPKKHQTPFDMQSVARRDVNRGHFLETLSKQFKQTPKHDHHKLFLSLSSFFVQKYRTTLPTPALSGIPYNTQAPTGNLDTVVAETYVGIPPNVTPQRKNIYMSGSGMLVHSPLLPQELDQSLTTMLPWISTALHTDSFNNVYNHVVKTKQLHHSSRLEQRNNDDGQGEGENGDNKVKSAESVVINGGMDLTKVALPPLADFTLHWM
jgi:23S rRNA A2030 N6-methylase RlmJ